MKIIISSSANNLSQDIVACFSKEGIGFEAYERHFDLIRKQYPGMNIVSLHLPQTQEIYNLANQDDLARIKEEGAVYHDYTCVLHAFYIPHNIPLSSKLSVVTEATEKYGVMPFKGPVNSVKKIPTATPDFLTSALYQDAYARFKANAKELPPNIILENINAHVGFGGNLFEHFKAIRNILGEPTGLCLDVAHLLFSCLAYGRNFDEELDLFLGSGRVVEIHACNTSIDFSTPKNELDDMHLPILDHTAMINWRNILEKAVHNKVRFLTIEVGDATGLKGSYSFIRDILECIKEIPPTTG